MSAPTCWHEDGTQHVLTRGADGLYGCDLTDEVEPMAPAPEPPDVTALAVDVTRDALALVSQLVDDALPMLLHAPWATDAQRARVRDAQEHAGMAWAHLTHALSTLGADVRPAVVEVTDL